MPPHQNGGYIDPFWAGLYATGAAFGANETALVWSRYTGFLVLHAFLVKIVSDHGHPDQGVLSLVAAGLGLAVTCVWHWLNYCGWLNQNLWYWTAARIRFSEVKVVLPTKYWEGTDVPKPYGSIYHLAQSIPLLLLAAYSAGLAYSLTLCCWRAPWAIALSALLFVLLIPILFAMESKEHKRVLKEIGTAR